MEYNERTYRSKINRERFNYFTLSHFETDLLLGVSKEADIPALRSLICDTIGSLRNQAESFIQKYPEFKDALSPVQLPGATPDELQPLMEASKITDTGPMAGIAGLFADAVGKSILDAHNIDEIIVENGGDIFAHVKSELTISVFAGKSPISEKLGLVIPAGSWGICSSSGKIGPSLNFGRADAVTIVCDSPVLADHLATGISNMVKTADDIEPALEKAISFNGVDMAVIILNDKVGMKGNLEIVPL